MRFALFSPGLLAVALAAAPGNVSEPVYWRYAHPDAAMLGGIEVKRIWQSPLADMLRSQVAELKVGKVPGAEFLEELDRVFVSAPAPAAGKQPPVLAVLTGRFDLARLHKLAAAEGASIKWYKGIEVIAPPKANGADVHFAIIDSQTAIVAQRGTLYAAIDRAKSGAAGPLSESNPLFARAVGMTPAYEAWLVSAVSPDAMLPQQGAAGEMFQKVRGMDFGLSLREGLGLDLSLDTDTAEASQQMAAGLQMMLGLGLANATGPQAAQMQEILRNLQISPEPNALRVSLRVPRQQLELAIAEMRKSVEGAVGGIRSAVRSSVPVRGDTRGFAALDRLAQSHVPAAPQAIPALATAPPPPPEPPRKMVVRIEGLDDGPLEIPYKKQ